MLDVLEGFEISAVKILILFLPFFGKKNNSPDFSLLSSLSPCLKFKNLHSFQFGCWKILVRLQKKHGLLLKAGSIYSVDK